MKFRPRTYATITAIVAGIVAFSYTPVVAAEHNFNVSGTWIKSRRKHVSFFISHEAFCLMFFMLIYHLCPRSSGCKKPSFLRTASVLLFNTTPPKRLTSPKMVTMVHIFGRTQPSNTFGLNCLHDFLAPRPFNRSARKPHYYGGSANCC